MNLLFISRCKSKEYIFNKQYAAQFCCVFKHILLRNPEVKPLNIGFV